MRGVSTPPAPTADRRRTPLWQLHKDAGARLIDFGGWDMPVSYPAGTLKEHKAVREALGLFDVSHMGEAFLRGPGARATVERLTTNAVASAPVGKAVYTLLCRPDGGIVDDCIFYKRADDDFFVIVNASNTAKDLAWMREHLLPGATLDDVSDATALIAVQGPRAMGVVTQLAGDASARIAALPSFAFTDAAIAGVPCVVARTGYTGEDGVELACATDAAPRLWQALMELATPAGGLAIGLGARDSLRLESKLPLYGNDLDDTTSPLEAGLGWAVKLDGRDFLGAEALRRQKADGVRRKLVGFRIADDARAFARHGYPILDAAGAPIGTVTSGGPAITVGGAIGLGYVPSAAAEPGTPLLIDCRGKHAAATVVSGKFYKRAIPS
jgi:aminomethyltransferase